MPGCSRAGPITSVDTHRPDLDLIVVVDFDLEIADVSAVDQGAVGAAEVAEEDPPVALLESRMLLAHLRGAEPELARPVAADQPAGGGDENGAGLALSDLDHETDRGPGTRPGARWLEAAGPRAEPESRRSATSARSFGAPPRSGGSSPSATSCDQDVDRELARRRSRGPGAVDGRGLIGMEVDLAGHADDREDLGKLGIETAELELAAIGRRTAAMGVAPRRR